MELRRSPPFATEGAGLFAGAPPTPFGGTARLALPPRIAGLAPLPRSIARLASIGPTARPRALPASPASPRPASPAPRAPLRASPASLRPGARPPPGRLQRLVRPPLGIDWAWDGSGGLLWIDPKLSTLRNSVGAEDSLGQRRPTLLISQIRGLQRDT